VNEVGSSDVENKYEKNDKGNRVLKATDTSP
jgi:hypothetical protein